MKETITSITTRDGNTIEHTGTGGFTITSTRKGDDVRVLMEFDVATKEEAVATIGTFLAQLDEIHGENFVAQCLSHYATETGKERMSNRGGRDIVRIRGYSDGRR